MTDWWTVPYAGGPMVGVPGFPRPLYPPDAWEHGKEPSIDGPDVIAYKRTCCRAGRWGDWDPASWDDSYSNNFAHGRGPNVKDTGIAGVQRQQHLDATGWIGQKTFNTLRSIKVPNGPHEGEMAMDSYAANLIAQAWEIFGGHEPPPTGTGTVRSAALARAVMQIGTKESPAGSNNQKYGSWYNMNGVPWCAIFATWCYELGAQDIGKDSPSFLKGVNYSYVPYIVSDAIYMRNRLTTTVDPIPGDLVCYDWEGDGIFDHVGIFEKWTSGTSGFNAVEGNTSTSNNSNGGEVMRRSRTRGGQDTVFVRVSEP